MKKGEVRKRRQKARYFFRSLFNRFYGTNRHSIWSFEVPENRLLCKFRFSTICRRHWVFLDHAGTARNLEQIARWRVVYGLLLRNAKPDECCTATTSIFESLIEQSFTFIRELWIRRTHNIAASPKFVYQPTDSTRVHIEQDISFWLQKIWLKAWQSRKQ